jgi:peptide/nickel transport system substrate-binding protein
VFTIKAIQSPDYQGNPAVADLWKNVTVDRLSDRRVRFTLSDAYAPFLEHVSQPLLPSHLLSGVTAAKLPENRFNIYPIGTGPFKVTEAGLKEVVLETNQDYHGEKPYLERIRFRFFADEKAASTALRKDEVQGIGGLSPEQAEALRPDKKLTVFSGPEFSKLTLLLLNTKSPVFGDKAVRQAVSHAIDRDKLVDVVMGGQAVKADSPVVPISWAYNREAKRYEYDLSNAKGILDEAGWRDENGDGIRERNGRSLSFVLLTNDRPLRIKAAEEISRQLQQAGIKVDVQAAGWSGFVQDFLVPRNFQAALAEQWSPGADPDTYQFWHSSQIKGNGLNFASWTNRLADELLENARRSKDISERTKLYRDFQSLFAEEQPGVLLYYPVFNYVQSKTIKGVRLGTLIEPSHRFDHVSEWYLRTERAAAN